MIELIIRIIGIILAIFIPILGFIYNRRRKLKQFYEIIWKKSSSLKPKHILGTRPFDKYYYSRKEDDKIKKCLDAKKNVLITGPPLSGKSRAVYQALTNLNKPYDVIIPRQTHINLETFLFPKHLKFWRTRMILFDDLHRFIEQQNFDYLFKIAIENNIVVVATCRSAMEYKKTKDTMLKWGIDLETTFGENIIEHRKVSEEVGKDIADKVGINWDKVKFDGNIGSIFMRLGEMERRFNKCTSTEKTILRAIRNLYISGIYQENHIFSLDYIKILCKEKGIEKDFKWTDWLENLQDKEFSRLVEIDKIQAEEVYLEYIVKPEVEIPRLEIFENMRVTFSGVPDALLKIGREAYLSGLFKLEKADYMKMAIKSYEKALKIFTPDRFPMDYAMTQINLGDAYGTLAEVEAKAENCRKAINAYKEVLKVRTLDRFPMDYAMTQHNLGIAYRTLAEVEAKAENCRKAIKSYEKALKIFTPDRFPMDYAMTQINLGNTYSTLAEVEAKAENCRKAIKLYEEALKIFTPDRFPMQYAMTQNNLGDAYRTLAEVEVKAENCRKAIKLYEEALKVRTLDRFPMDYAMTQHNLGNAYSTLAEVEAKAENCRKAIKLYEEALKIFTPDRFPMDYAMTQYNLGNTYGTLAEVEAKAENCRKAIKSYEEALKIFTKEGSSEIYTLVAGNLTNVLRFCEGEK